MGAGIETFKSLTGVDASGVAPYLGEWIETSQSLPDAASILSHLTWVRGLKLR